MPLAHIALAVESGSWLSEHAFPLMVMQQLLGSWDRTGGAGANQASKLTQTVAEMELAHSVSSFNTCYKDTGLFGKYSKRRRSNVAVIIVKFFYSFIPLLLSSL